MSSASWSSRGAATAFCAMALWVGLPKAQAAVPQNICPAAQAPTIDGAMADGEWKDAAKVMDFRRIGGDDLAPAPTEVSIMHDATCLYLAAQCRFQPGHKIESFVDKDNDDEVWTDDCMEVFLCPNPASAEYFQIIVNSKGRVYAARLGGLANLEGPRPLTPLPKAAAKVADGVLTLELAVTFQSLGVVPKTGEVWGLKLCRTHWDRSPTTQPNRPGNIYTSNISPTSDYHAQPYGQLVFDRETAETRRALSRMAGAAPFKAPLYHNLEEVKRTHVWARPWARTFRDGACVGERLIFRDAVTGAEIWRVTFNASGDGVSYANVFPWNCNGSLMLFGGRDRPNGAWYMMMDGDGARIWRPKPVNDMSSARWTPDDPDVMFTSAGRNLARLNIRTGQKVISAKIPENVPGTVNFDPLGEWAAVCKQGFGADGKVTVVNCKTGEAREIPLRTASQDFSGDWLYSAAIAWVSDQAHVGYSLNHLPHLSREHQYQQWLMNLKTGEYRLVKYLSHGGTSPKNDRKVGFWSGGVFTTDYFGDDKKFVMQIDTDGHIPWMSSPEWCLAGTSGTPGSSLFGDQLVQVYVNTGNWCRIAYGQTANTTYDSNLFANTSPDGSKVEFTSTMLGPKCIYCSDSAAGVEGPGGMDGRAGFGPQGDSHGSPAGRWAVFEEGRKAFRRARGGTGRQVG